MPEGPVRACALFAHCFTCSKDSLAASRISAALSDRGVAVLRFDFTGLGGSDGDFANTNFSSNVADLVAAAAYLRERHHAPDLLIGHSLGGAAVLAAAGDIPEAKLVATIGAPADVAHVVHQFGGDLDRIRADGEAEVKLAGRPFTIRRQFVDDVEGVALADRISKLRRALVIFHSPTDNVVGIDNAAAIFTAAKHPKSFISLDGADHLLSRRADAGFVASMLEALVERHLADAEPVPADEAGSDNPAALVEETGTGKFQNRVTIGHHVLLADEPVSVGGTDTGPTPYDFLKTALGACTTMTLRLYAARKGLEVKRLGVTVTHDKSHAEDCETCLEKGLTGKVDTFRRVISIEGDVDEAARQRLLEIADLCPVHRSLESVAVIESELGPS